jgi:hypothetical protein
MAVLAERDRLEKERNLHEIQLHQKQLGYLLERCGPHAFLASRPVSPLLLKCRLRAYCRCNAYATQATLVTGFAFTSFSADALKDLSYKESPVRSFLL